MEEALALLGRNGREGGETLADQRAHAFVLAARPGGRREALDTLERLGGALAPDEQFRLAQLYEAEGDGRALELMQGLLARDGRNPAYLAQHIEGLLRRGKAEEARQCLARLKQVEPDSERTRALQQRVSRKGQQKRTRKNAD